MSRGKPPTVACILGAASALTCPIFLRRGEISLVTDQQFCRGFRDDAGIWKLVASKLLAAVLA